jgi:hypothetical protein
MKYLHAIAVFGFLFTVTPCLAVIKPYYLDEMIDESKLVLVGRVVKIAETSRTESGKDTLYDLAVATIEIEQIILGSYEEKQIDVTYFFRLSIAPYFEIGERCVLFIGQSNGRNSIVKGYAGMIPIKNTNVEVHHILGEQERQALKDFIQRIKDTKSKQGTILKE